LTEREEINAKLTGADYPPTSPGPPPGARSEGLTDLLQASRAEEKRMTRKPDNSPDPEGASQERGVLDEALEPDQIRSLNSALRKLSETDGVGKDLQEAAKKLLSGRLALRDALDDPAVSRALGGGMASLRGQWEALSEEERDQIRHGEPLAGGGPSSDSSEPRRSEGENPQSGKRNQGRHSGGFSLY
jgi:hypothetical protein